MMPSSAQWPTLRLESMCLWQSSGAVQLYYQHWPWPWTVLCYFNAGCFPNYTLKITPYTFIHFSSLYIFQSDDHRQKCSFILLLTMMPVRQNIEHPPLTFWLVTLRKTQVFHNITDGFVLMSQDAMTVWHWASINKTRTLHLKQLKIIYPSLFLLFTHVLFLL